MTWGAGRSVSLQSESMVGFLLDLSFECVGDDPEQESAQVLKMARNCS